MKQNKTSTFKCSSCEKSFDTQPLECEVCWKQYCQNCYDFYDDQEGCYHCKDTNSSNQGKSQSKTSPIQVFKDLNVNNKQQLADIRIIQKNLIYLIGLSPQISNNAATLKKPEYLGQYGTIQKMIIISSHNFNPPSNAAYVTFANEKEASLAILACESLPMHDLTIRASFGTTKFCSFFLKGQQCPKIKECVYLHSHPKDKESQILKKDEMNNNKWLFPHSQKVAVQNAIKNLAELVQLKIKQKQQKLKTVFPSIEELLDKLVQQNYITDQQLKDLEVQQNEKGQKTKSKKNTVKVQVQYLPQWDQDTIQKAQNRKNYAEGNSTDSVESDCDSRNISQNPDTLQEELERKIVDLIINMNLMQAQSRFNFIDKKNKEKDDKYKEPIEQIQQWIKNDIKLQ